MHAIVEINTSLLCYGYHAVFKLFNPVEVISLMLPLRHAYCGICMYVTTYTYLRMCIRLPVCSYVARSVNKEAATL